MKKSQERDREWEQREPEQRFCSSYMIAATIPMPKKYSLYDNLPTLFGPVITTMRLGGPGKTELRFSYF